MQLHISRTESEILLQAIHADVDRHTPILDRVPREARSPDAVERSKHFQRLRDLEERIVHPE